jgi:7-methyl-GTP pyrophosphatase
VSGRAAIDLVLASSSPYRRDLLTRIVPDFRQVRPAVDESPQDGETAAGLAARLARAKARDVAGRCPGAIVIGSDQAAELGDNIVGKPGGFVAAAAQLARASGERVVFHTALCVVDARSPEHAEREASDRTCVLFRTLSPADIARYLERERPFDCAGSFKAEGLGIALFERIESVDPTALVGLPLIATCRLLRELGIDVI